MDFLPNAIKVRTDIGTPVQICQKGVPAVVPISRSQCLTVIAYDLTNTDAVMFLYYKLPLRTVMTLDLRCNFPAREIYTVICEAFE